MNENISHCFDTLRRFSPAWGLAYLTLYNFLYVLPLLAILCAAGNRVTAKTWAAWEREHASSLRLWFGLIMVGLGAVMLWVVIPSGGI